MSFASPHADVELPDSGLHAFLFAGLGPADLDGVALVSARVNRQHDICHNYNECHNVKGVTP
ncbi:hypothetical protein [Streptomyces coeruleorubidus]|uniref:hypothetical protein n=1 Tax=Streptomyces coeruleorubidus TaxID=116188 RepID=UPI0033A13363